MARVHVPRHKQHARVSSSSVHFIQLSQTCACQPQTRRLRQWDITYGYVHVCYVAWQAAANASVPTRQPVATSYKRAAERIPVSCNHTCTHTTPAHIRLQLNACRKEQRSAFCAVRMPKAVTRVLHDCAPTQDTTCLQLCWPSTDGQCGYLLPTSYKYNALITCNSRTR